MRRAWAPVLALVALTGCYRYTSHAVPAPSQSTPFHAGKARITLTDGRQFRMEQVYTRNDSLVTDHPLGNGPTSLPLSQVSQIDVGKVSTSRTILMVLAALEVALVALYVIILTTDDS